VDLRPYAVWFRNPKLRWRGPWMSGQVETEFNRIHPKAVQELIAGASGVHVRVTRTDSVYEFSGFAPDEPTVTAALESLFQSLPLYHGEGDGEWPSAELSLSWHKLPGSNERTRLGELVYHAKYGGDAAASEECGSERLGFVPAIIF
jgi:hypothetical protein